MEIIKKEIKHTLAVSADDIKGEVTVLNGNVVSCKVNLFDANQGDVEINLTESQIRQLSKEFSEISLYLDTINQGKDG